MPVQRLALAADDLAECSGEISTPRLAPRRRAVGYVPALLVVAIWGVSFAFQKKALDEILTVV